MISYHPASKTAPVGTPYTPGFRVADIDDVHRIARCMSQYAWSPCAWKDGDRRKENFLRANWFALDFDTPDMTLEEAVKSFCDMIHIIGTTRNHRKLKKGMVCDRFRVVIKASETMTERHVYEGNMYRLAKRWPIDSQCCDAGRHFFACSEIISVSAEGYTEDVIPVARKKTLDAEAYAALVRARAAKHAAGKPLPVWLKRFLSEGTCLGGGRNKTAYAAAIALLELAYDDEEAASMIWQSPFPKDKAGDEFTYEELRQTVLSARKFVARRMCGQSDQDA